EVVACGPAPNRVRVGWPRPALAGRFTFANPRYCEIVGYAPTELLEMRMQDLTHAEDLSGYLDQFHQLVDGGEDFVIEQRSLRKDGRVIWVSNSVSSVRDANG